MPNNPRLDIAVQVQYKEMLKQMKADFKRELTEISTSTRKSKIYVGIKEQIDQINQDVDEMLKNFEKKFEEINSQTISAKAFEEYQTKVSKEFDKMKNSVAKISGQIKGLKEQIGILNSTDVASNMQKQFDNLCQSLLKTYEGLKEVVDITKTVGGAPSAKLSESATKDYKETLDIIKRVRKETEELNFDNIDDSSLNSNLEKQYKFLQDNIEAYRQLKKEVTSMSKSDLGYAEKLNELRRFSALIYGAYDALEKLNAIREDRTGVVKSDYNDLLTSLDATDNISSMDSRFEKWESTINKILKKSKDASEQIQGTFNTFRLKDGAIHIPIDIATDNSELKNKINEIVKELGDYIETKPIIAKVKLVLDGNNAKGRKKNIDFDQQQKDGQKKKSVDFGSTVQKTVRDGAKLAEETINTAIKTIEKELKEVPVTIKPDTEAFKKDLKAMVDNAFKSIAEDTTGLNVNNELEKLVENLKEVSSSLSGNEGFKFGLDEDSINAITKAIQSMADMIQRAFGVASNEDIDAQWDVITNKFKAIAKENDKLPKQTKEQKAAVQDLAVEYKKYLDMGGKEDLSNLTKNRDSIRKIKEEYEKLNVEVKETQDVLEQKGTDVVLTPTGESFKADAEKILDAINLEKEVKLTVEGKSIGDVQDDLDKTLTKAEIAQNTTSSDGLKDALNNNKSLAQQADKTTKALGTEGDVAHTAAERFAELAREKKAATDANLELGIAAEMTANALKEEAKAKKEAEKTSKPNKNAIDGDVYTNNALDWQRNITQSLLDSGDYEEIYDAKISQGANGVVKFTAAVKVMEDGIDDAEAEWKQFTATVNSSGEISSPQIKELNEKQIANIEMQLKKAEKIRALMDAMDGQGADPVSYNRDEIEKYIEDILKAEGAIDEFNVKKVSLNEDGSLAITTELKDANGQIKTFVANFDSIESVINTTNGTVKDLGQSLQKAFDSGKVTVTVRDLKKEAKGLFDAFKTKNSGKSGFRYFSDDLKNLEQAMDAIGNLSELDEFKQKLSEIADRINLVGKAQRAFDKFKYANEGKSGWSEIDDDVKKLVLRIKGISNQTELDEFTRDLANLGITLRNVSKDAHLGERFKGLDKTFKDINEIRANIDSLFASMGKVNEKSIKVTGTDKLTAEVKAANGEIRKMTVSLDSKGFARFVDNGIAEFGRLRKAAEGVFKGIKDMVRIYLSPQDFIRYFKQGFDKVKEMDIAMTELKKVSDASAGQLAAYFDEATASAKELGSSVKDMIGATADWSRMGYNLPDSKELGEVAVLYKNVGDGISVEEANSSLVSTLQGFQMNANEAIKIVDSFNEVSNNFAINSGGIGEALKRSAAAFNAANTDLNKSIALITAGNEIVQSPEKVGTMWQTVSARIRGTKTELEELGEDTENVLSSSKLRSLVMGYTDVDIMKDANNYKDIYEIVSEIGKKWKDLKDVERAALLEGLAGKKQSNTLAAVLNNAERLEEIYQTAEKSAGSAQREQVKYTQSLQYSLDQLTAHGEEFWSTFIKKDDVKIFIDLINGTIEKVTKLVDLLGSIPTTAGVLGLFSSLRGGGMVRTVTNKLGQTSLTGNGFLKDIKGIATGEFFKKQSVVNDDDILALRNYNNAIKHGVNANTAFDKTMKNASKSAQHLAKSAKGATVDLGNIPKASRAATVGLKALSTVMNVGLSVAISWLITGLFKMADAYDEMVQNAADATATYKEQSSSIEEYKDKITDLKTALSSESLTYTDARNKRSQLIDIQKQLIDTYGAEAKGIDLVNGSLDEQIGKLDALNANKRQEWENEVNKLSTGQQWQKWAGGIGLALLDIVTLDWSLYDMHEWFDDFDNTTNIERIAKEFENFKKSISLSDLELDTEERDALEAQLKSYDGVSIQGHKMTIAGDAKTVAETVSKIQTQVIGSREELQGLDQDLKDVYNSAKKVVDENWDTYNTAIQNKILDDDTGLKYYGKLTEAYDKYQEAVKSGDKESIDDAKEKYAAILTDIENSNMDESFKKFFKNMYPDIADIIKEWKFEVNIIPKINTNKDGLNDNIEAVKGLTIEEIEAAFDNNGDGVSKEQWKAITNLNKEAQANGLDLSTFLNQLKEAGYLTSQLDRDIEDAVNNTKSKYGKDTDWNQYFKDKGIDTQEELDRWNEVTKGINNAEDAMKAYEMATLAAEKSTVSLEETSKALDSIQSAYDTVQSAINEYNQAGYFSVDTFQALISLTPEYLNMLMDENGNLNLNTDAVRQNTAAYIENMGIKAAQNLIDTVSGLSGATAQMEYLTGATVENTGATWNNIYAQIAAAEAVSDPAVIAALQQRIFALKAMTDSAISGIGKGGLGKDANKQAEQQKKHNLEILKESLEAQEDIINRYKKSAELMDFGIELADEHDFSSRADLISNKLNQLTLYGSAMREEFDRVAGIVPKTADEAQALADRLENLGQEMRDNISNLRETQIELQKLKIDAITHLGTDALGELESELEDIERRMEILSGDNENDYQYTNQILSMKALIPTRSDFNKQAAEKRRQNKEIIDVEQETQDTINDIVTKSLEMQADENEKAREKERLALKEDLNKVSADYNTFLKNFEVSTTDTTTNVAKTFDDMASNIQVAFDKIKTTTWNWQNDFLPGLSPFLNLQPSGNSSKIINTANQYLGTPYIFGGNSLTNGIDCSGFTQQVLKANGVSISRTAEAQWNDTSRVKKEELQPGDLVFFKDTYKSGISHVGIYQGQGKFIHASTSKGVTISNLNDEYYLKHWAGGGRYYAKGTPGGNALAKNLGIAGENYKPEILVDKTTGKTTYIDEPTVIDVSKTDVVGEKATASIPKFANGSNTPLNQLDKLTVEQIQKILSTNFANSSKLNAPGVAQGIYNAQQSTGISALATLAIAAGESGWGTSKVANDKNNFWGWNHYAANGKTAYQRATTFSSDMGLAFEDYSNKLIKSGYSSKSIVEMAMKYCPDGTWDKLISGTLSSILTTVGNDIGTGNLPTVASSGINNFLEVLEKEYQKVKDWGLEPYLQEIKTGTIQSVFGNVDMDKRTIITWSEELKNTYRDALASWEYNPEIGSIDTVFGGSGRFGEDINGIGWEVAFTPILPDGTFLSKDTVYEYINNILVEAYGNDHSITGDELKAIDSQGRQVGETFIKGIFAAIDDSQNYDNNGNWAETVGRLMHFSGDFGAVELAKNAIIKSGSGADKNNIVEYIDLLTNAAIDTISGYTSDARVQQLSIMNDKNIPEEDKYAKLVSVYKPLATQGAKIGTDAYTELTNLFVDWYNQTKENPELWSQEVYDFFIESLDSIEENVYNLEKGAVDFSRSAVDNRWAISENWINDRNTYNDWALFDDNEVAAWERVVKWLNKDYPDQIDKIKEAEKNLFEARKREFEKGNNFANTYLESHKTLLQSHYDVTNAISEAQHEINKELETSKTMYEYLDEDTRKLLFNQEDYNTLYEELSIIQNKANKLQKQYEADLSGATLETIESITSNYQMQYETLMKSYEIAKADLEIVKKKAKLNNVLKERNVRMFVNGSWQWVANTENVSNARSELADAEYAKQVEEAGLTQQTSINNLTQQQDALSVIMKKFENGIISLNDAVGSTAKTMSNMPGALFQMLVNATPDTKAYSQGATSGSYNGTWFDGGTDYMDAILNATNKADVAEYNKIRNAKILGNNLGEQTMTNAEAIEKWEEAQWLKNSKVMPITALDLWGDNNGKLMFDTSQMQAVGGLWNASAFHLGNSALSGVVQPQQVDQSQDNRIIINGMTVDDGSIAGKDLIDALRRYVGNH